MLDVLNVTGVCYCTGPCCVCCQVLVSNGAYTCTKKQLYLYMCFPFVAAVLCFHFVAIVAVGYTCSRYKLA